MTKGISGDFVAVAAVLCCALPLLILSGFLAAGSGAALSQLTLLAVGVLIVILAGLSWIIVKRRNKMGE